MQFESQTKSKLGTADAKVAVDQVITEQLKFYLAEKGEIANVLIGNAIRAFKEREAVRKARDEIREVKDKKVLGILVTHYHPDHVGALEDIIKEYNVIYN